MKVIKVRLLNINSLKGEFAIDFEKFLNGESLFAITGPTGAGKSTILDVITCALFGKTPRLSNPNELMSRHSGECFCEVEFEIKGKSYRSSWSQKRARKKADGAFQNAKMEIVDLEEDKIIESKVSKVPKKVEQISGLDFERFVQSMMLAQGSFDAFLKAKENDRSNLLEKITGTYIYKQISQEIYEIYIQKKKEIENDEIALGAIEIRDPQAIQEKSKQLQAYKKEKEKLDSKELELKKLSAYLESLQKLESDSQRYNQEFEQISQEKEQNKEQFTKLDLANKALRIQPLVQEKNQLSNTIANDTQTLDSLQVEYKSLKELIQIKEQEFTTSKANYEKEKTTYEQNYDKLKEVRILQTQSESTKSSSLQIDKKISSHLQALAKDFETSYEALLNDGSQMVLLSKNFSASLAATKQEFKVLQERYKTLNEQTKDIDSKEQNTRVKLQETQSLLKALEDYENLQSQIAQEKSRLKEYTTQIESMKLQNSEKSKLLDQINQTLNALKQTREKELLIKNYEENRVKLQEGDECFLCGSKTHPYITNALTIDLDKTTLKIKEQERYWQEQNQELKSVEINLATLHTKAESTNLQLQKLQNNQTELEIFFDANKLKIGSNSKTTLQDQTFKCEAKLKEYKHLREQKEALQLEKEALQARATKQEQKEHQIKTNINAIEELKEEQTKLKIQINHLQTQSKNILDVEDVELFEKKIQQSLDSASRDYNSLQNLLSSLQSKDESLTKQMMQLHTKYENDKQNLETLKQRVEKAFKEYGFDSKEEFERANLSKEEYEALANQCKSIQDRYTQIQALKIDTAQKLQQHKKSHQCNQNLKDINQELQELQSAIDKLQESIGSISKELEIDASNMKKYEDKIKALEEKKESSKVWVKLNDMIGSSQGDKFAKFAQGITLDQLIYLANRYLTLLSPRYELQRSDTSNKLLEIEIVDGFQGDAVRGVNTLSGGESFIVSLSLALGLSSLASQKISIDSLFLDEGFGTLDSQSLELALNALNGLQSTGKTVGVISHVEALKERIPLQIKIEPKGDGTSEICLSESP